MGSVGVGGRRGTTVVLYPMGSFVVNCGLSNYDGAGGE